MTTALEARHAERSALRNRPAHAAALLDARDQARRALSALRSLSDSPCPQATLQRIAPIYDALSTVLIELELTIGMENMA